MTEQTAADQSAAPPAPPPLHRRPRVREVSSRFMSPLIQTPIPKPNPNLASDLPRSKSAHRRPPSKTDENRVPETNRGHFDKSSGKVVSTVQRKQQRVKHDSKESSDDHHHFPEARFSSRPDTPIAIGTDRVVPSRYRQVPNSTIRRPNSLNSSSSSCSTFTAAARLLQEATSDVEKRLSRISTSNCSGDDRDSNQGSSSCPNSPLCVVPVNKAARSGTDVRSSMPDVDKWLAENNSSENCGRSAGDCARSLNFSVKLGGGGVSRPPQHPSACVRSGLEVRKGRKVSNHQEDVHSLKMLSNHYLQWRFANAKAEASSRAQKQEAEIKLYSLGSKISAIRDSVKKKRAELSVLQRIKTLTTVVEAQMPYLDEWSCLEEDYSSSLSGTTNALLSSSLRVPISAEVRADPGEISDAMSSALKVAELISCHIERFIPNAEEMDISITELARMAGGEKSRIEECDDLLSRTYTSQVRECSLRGTLMQLHQNHHHHITSEELKATS